MLSYQLLMTQLGLSQHINQLNRRIAKYPKHFIKKNDKWMVSKQLASYLVECKAHEILTINLKIEGGSI